MRRFGLANLQKAQIKMLQGQSPTQEMLNAVAIVLGGIFMIIPGLLLSLIGLFLLIPGLRNPFANWILSKSKFTMAASKPVTPAANDIQPEGGRIIEGEAWKNTDDS
jgi:UPF0716 protein FxsA